MTLNRRSSSSSSRNGPPPPSQLINRDLNAQNSTLQHFMRFPQKSWMTNTPQPFQLRRIDAGSRRAASHNVPATTTTTTAGRKRSHAAASSSPIVDATSATVTATATANSNVIADAVGANAGGNGGDGGVATGVGAATGTGAGTSTNMTGTVYDPVSLSSSESDSSSSPVDATVMSAGMDVPLTTTTAAATTTAATETETVTVTVTTASTSAGLPGGVSRMSSSGTMAVGGDAAAAQQGSMPPPLLQISTSPSTTTTAPTVSAPSPAPTSVTTTSTPAIPSTSIQPPPPISLAIANGTAAIADTSTASPALQTSGSLPVTAPPSTHPQPAHQQHPTSAAPGADITTSTSSNTTAGTASSSSSSSSSAVPTTSAPTTNWSTNVNSHQQQPLQPSISWPNASTVNTSADANSAASAVLAAGTGSDAGTGTAPGTRPYTSPYNAPSTIVLSSSEQSSTGPATANVDIDSQAAHRDKRRRTLSQLHLPPNQAPQSTTTSSTTTTTTTTTTTASQPPANTASSPMNSLQHLTPLITSAPPPVHDLSTYYPDPTTIFTHCEHKSFEFQRLSMLVLARKERDLFYLILHQLYCALSIQPGRQLNGLTQVHRDGIQLFAPMLVSNVHLRGQFLLQSSNYPDNIDACLEKIPNYSQTYQSVLLFFEKVAKNLNSLDAHIKQRNFPPLIEEMVSQLAVPSAIIQHVIHTAYCRAMINDRSDAGKWLAEFDVVYQHNQKIYSDYLNERNRITSVTAGMGQAARGDMLKQLNAVSNRYRQEVAGMYNALREEMEAGATPLGKGKWAIGLFVREGGSIERIGGVPRTLAPASVPSPAPPAPPAPTSNAFQPPERANGSGNTATSGPVPIPARQLQQMAQQQHLQQQLLAQQQHLQQYQQQRLILAAAAAGTTTTAPSQPLFEGRRDPRTGYALVNPGPVTPITSGGGGGVVTVTTAANGVVTAPIQMDPSVQHWAGVQQGQPQQLHLQLQQQQQQQQRPIANGNNPMTGDPASLGPGVIQQYPTYPQTLPQATTIAHPTVPIIQQNPIATVVATTAVPAASNIAAAPPATGPPLREAAIPTRLTRRPQQRQSRLRLQQQQLQLQSQQQQQPQWTPPPPPPPPPQQSSNLPVRNFPHHPQAVPPPAPPPPPPPAAPAPPAPPANIMATLPAEARAPLFPPPDVQPTVFANPRPRVIALHEAHLAYNSRPVDQEGKVDRNMELFQYFESFVVPPKIIQRDEPTVLSEFNVPDEMMKKLPKPASDKTPSGREIWGLEDGKKILQIRCIKDPKSRMINDHRWAAADTTWPEFIFICFNGVEMTVRRKGHYGKDLPLNITPHVLDGRNILAMTVMYEKRAPRPSPSYMFAVELIDTASRKRVRSMVRSLAAAKSLSEIQKRLNASSMAAAAAEDSDELCLVDDDLTIDLTDPFSVTIFKTPVRGTSCSHRECFDLDTFLDTRLLTVGWNRVTEKMTEGEGMAEEWKCPICGQDARPRSLMIDGFLVEVRKKLEESGKLDARAVRVKKDGSWEVKLQEPIRARSSGSDSRRNSSRRNDEGGIARIKREGPSGSSVVGSGESSGKAEPMVIEID